MLGATKKNRNIRGLTINQEAHKPGASAALNGTAGSTQQHRRSNASDSTASSTATSSASSSLSVPQDACSSGSSPSLPSSAFSSSGGDGSSSFPLVTSSSISMTMTSSSRSSKGKSKVDRSTTSSSSSAAAYHTKLSERLANLEVGVEFKLDLRAEDLEGVNELGHGNGGTVTLVRHIPTGAIMARKVVHIDAKPSVRKQILRELQIMHDCNSPYIVSFYGAYLQDTHICMCMEYMDKGSLDNIYKSSGPVAEDVLGKIAFAVVSGLTYLYDVHRIMHRDVKPSNILVNSQGQIKLCDFGVSGELVNSIADTFVGTSTYMSPERIQGAQYTVKSDVWSFGITLIELAMGRFPFSSEDSDDDFSGDEATLSPVRPGGKERALADAEARKAKRKAKREKEGVSLGGSGSQMSILELLQHVVNEPAPRLKPEGKFKKETEIFVDSCLMKDVNQRPTPKELLRYKWLVDSAEAQVDLEAWAKSLR